MRHPLVRLIAVAMALALFGACSSSGSNGTADTTVPTAPPQTTTTAAADPFAIPDVIDEAYVNRVLAALDQINGDVVRQIISTGAVGPESLEHIRAAYNDPEYEVEVMGLQRLLEADLSAFKSPPGNRKSHVKRIVVARRDCLFVEAVVDFSEVVRNPEPPVVGEFEAITLRPTQRGADPKSLNPTPWSVAHDEVVTPGAAPKEQPCTQ